MHPVQFISRLEHDQIVAAIRKAEATTTGEIHFVVGRGKVEDAVKAAHRHFEHLELHRSPGRNTILIFVAPKSQKFAVVGDHAVHRRVGDAAWQSLAAGMADHFKNGRFMPGILFGIGRAGELLTEHFPKPS